MKNTKKNRRELRSERRAVGKEYERCRNEYLDLMCSDEQRRELKKLTRDLIVLYLADLFLAVCCTVLYCVFSLLDIGSETDIDVFFISSIFGCIIMALTLAPFIFNR